MNDPIQEALEEARRQAEGAPERPRGRGNGEMHDEAWRSQLQVNAKGNLLMNLNNAALILRHEHAGKFRYSELEHGAVDGSGRPINDADVIRMQESLQKHSGLRLIARATVQDAIELVAEDYSFHPIRDYLDSLEWDGTARIDWLFPFYFGSFPLREGMELEDVHPYHKEIGCRLMLSLVARIYDPGCQQDYVVIIEGEQGLLKSSACRTLVGEIEWFGSNLPDISNKDSSQYMRGKWIIEIPEMHKFFGVKKDDSELKSFITRREERYFARYGRKESFEKRQCVFIGTTNESNYLKDTTGSRRYWPILAGAINLDLLERDRDQLFAEAVVRYRAGEKIWPDSEFEKQFIKPEQEERYQLDEWEGAIAKYLDGMATTAVRAIDVYVAVFSNDKSKFNRSEQLRVESCLQRLGWKKGLKDRYGRLWNSPLISSPASQPSSSQDDPFPF